MLGEIVPGMLPVAAVPIVLPPFPVVAPVTSAFAIQPSRGIPLARSVGNFVPPAVRYGAPLAAVACSSGEVAVGNIALTGCALLVLGGIHALRKRRAMRSAHATPTPPAEITMTPLSMTVNDHTRAPIVNYGDFERALDPVMDTVPSLVSAVSAEEVATLAEVRMSNGVQIIFGSDGSNGPRRLRVEISAPPSAIVICELIRRGTLAFAAPPSPSERDLLKLLAAASGRIPFMRPPVGNLPTHPGSHTILVQTQDTSKPLQVGIEVDRSGYTNSWLSVYVPPEADEADRYHAWIEAWLDAHKRAFLFMTPPAGMMTGWKGDRWEISPQPHMNPVMTAPGGLPDPRQPR